MVKKWLRQLNDGRISAYDESRSGQPSVVTYGLVEKLNQKICENSRFTIRLLCDEFPQTQTAVQYWLSLLAVSFYLMKVETSWFPYMTNVCTVVITIKENSFCRALSCKN
ncbi:HTH_48 domain-containing protein [Trichonephila clavipes]|nr:HTH_48 domain-containing protein [Trichonephila clavipes]